MFIHGVRLIRASFSSTAWLKTLISYRPVVYLISTSGLTFKIWSRNRSFFSLIPVDVTKPEEVQALVDAAKDSFGGLDVIFNNAGIMPNSPMSAVRTDEWDKMIDVNLKGVLNGIAAVLPTFTAQKHGHIITTSSVAGLKNYVGSGVYGATKFAVKNAMEVTRMESANEGTNIRTTTLYPAAINTELLDHIGDKKTASNMKNFYKQHGISPDAIARVVNFAIDQPEDVDISEFTIYPTNQA